MTLNLRVSPRRTQVELYKGQQFCVSGTTATVVWYFVANRSGGTIDPATGFYTAGPVNNVEDVIEARDPVTGDRGRAWVKVIPPPYVRNEKIIICAGGGNYPGNSILSQTNYLANYAYRMSLKRGYRKQDIYYLNADGSRIHDADGDGLNDANATATLVNLQWAISTWASDARRLFIYMVDHGTPTQFRVNPAEFLSAATFDAWLDTLQVTYGTTVIVVLDYCYSGSFLASCTAPPGRRRTVIASAGSNELATFLAPYGYISFSNFFLGYAHMGANLFDSFAWTRDALNFTYAGQIPRIDDNGDGLSNKNDGYYARTQYWGFDYGFGATPPEIVEVTPDRILNGENSTLLYCRVVPTLPVSRVWAVIQPPGGLAYSGGEPITDMPQVELFTTDGTYYSAVCTQFGRLGSYTLIYYAIDIEGRVSWPRKSRIMQLSAPDSYEVDDEARLASEYIFSNVAEFPPEQRHNFHDAGDTDWIRFWALGGRSYTMYIENCGSMCDAVLELYNGSLTLLTSVDWNGAGLGEMLTWNFPTTGTYYWKVYNYQPAVHGEGTSYTARLADNSGAGLGIATALGSNKLRMEWTSGLGPTDQGFNVYRYNSTTGNWVKINTMPVTSNSYVDGNLMPSRTYYYLIRLLRADGSEPAWTGYFSGTTSDSVCFASAGQTVSENCGTVWIGVQLSKSPASPVTVTYGVGGTATAGTDYVMPSGTLVFAAGQQSKYLELTINDDGRDEPDETIILVLTGRTNGDVGEPTTYTLTIQDNDESPGVQSVSLLDGTPTNAPSVRFRVVFSKAVSGVDAGDFSTSPTGLTGTAISNVAGVDQIWTVTVGTGAGSGRLSLVVEDNDTIVDGAGNPLGGAGAGNGRYTAGPAYDIDRVAPTVAIASSAEDPTSEWPIPVTVTFSEPVIGFEASDVTCSSCTVTNFTGEGANYSFGLVPWYQGEVTAQVCAGVASDAVGNGNMQSAVLMRTFESPTRVEGCTYAAKRKGSLVWIEWQTARELGNLGFHVYREAEGHLERLTSELVAGSALLAGAGVHLPAGQSYGWWDMAAPDGARYWIEDWDIGGGQTLHGPVVPVDAEVLPADTQSALLAQLNRQDDAERIRAVRAALQKTAVMRDTARPSTAPLSSPRPLASFTQLFHPTNPANAPSPLDRQWALAAGPAVKIVVAREGVQRISRAELVTAGLDPACNPRDLQLYYRGCEIPITVVMSGEGRRASWDAIEFYAEGQDTLWTDARTYWLVVGTKPGLRLKTAAGGGQNWPSPAAFLETIERKDRTIYFAALRNGAEENFFGPIITGEGVEQVLSLPYPILEPAGTHLLSRTSPSTATLEVWLQGVTAGAHRVAIYLNDIKVGVAEFEGLERGAAQFTVSHSLLRAGDNLIGLRALGGASDVSLVDRIRLCYWRTYAAHKNRLHCTAPGGTRVLIGGFSSPAITVLDITDPLSPHRLEGEVARNRSGYAITVAVQGKGERVLHAYGQGATERPAAVAANCPSQWNAAGRAYDMAIIAHETLTSTVAPLAALRASQGYRVAVVAVEDLYDEFNFGEKSALALRDFLRRTVTAWHQPPKYVLLVGDASFDPRNYLGFGNSDLVPTKLVDTELIETACDDWFADLNEDGLAEMAVGRLPVRNAAEAAALVSKIIGYESAWSSLFGGLVRSSHRRDLASIPSPNIETIRTSPAEAGTTYPYPADLATPHWAKTILLVADNNDLFNFERASAEIGALAPAEFTVERVCLGTSDLPTARAMLLECLTSGALMVNYIGHGSFETWAAERLFTAHDAESLTNAPRLPFVISMTCLNGFTHNPRADSLAEGLLKNPRGGAVAVWASSGLTEPIQQSVMNKELIRRLFGSRAPTLGEAITAAKAAIGNPDIRRTWVLLGDPSMRVK
ncbi:MAG: C25 family cysteine peptidase [Candidatus Sumerlaeia bacterium]|nr:C25 family cysteine peptidase [Candidatus Sumerlaeia bacterium]